MDALISFFLLADLAQGLGSAAGTISAISMVAVFGGLVGAAVSGLSERHIGGIKTSLVIAAVGALAWLVTTAFFGASGIANNITPTALNTILFGL